MIHQTNQVCGSLPIEVAEPKGAKHIDLPVNEINWAQDTIGIRPLAGQSLQTQVTGDAGVVKTVKTQWFWKFDCIQVTRSGIPSPYTSPQKSFLLPKHLVNGVILQALS